MPLIEFPYTLHKGYLTPIIPISIYSHKVWVFVDSGATFSILSVDDAERLGVGFNLLGRTGVFDQFEVCFNDRVRKVTFQQLSPNEV